MRPLLDVRNVSLSFGGLEALDGVSFTAQRGEIVGLIGPNGAGKTTLFDVMNGFLRPSGGDVLLEGKIISGCKPHRVCGMGVARTFQIVKPLRRMSVLDNVLVSAFLRARTRREAEAKAGDALAFTGLDSDRDSMSDSLPLGRRKRLEIARALATDPKLLLLDESFAGLNPTELNESIAVVRRIQKRGVTVVIIEHHMRIIMSLCDTIVVLNYGKKIAEGAPQAIQNDAGVVLAYLGEAHGA